MNRICQLGAALAILSLGLSGCSVVSQPSPTTPPPPPTETPLPPREPGETRIDQRGIEQVWVPPGSFLMGTSTDVVEQHPYEQPQHVVALTSGFWIDKYEVTNDAFQDFVEDGAYLEQEHWSEAGWEWLGEQTIDDLPVSCTEEVPDHPRVCVTWYEAEAYSHWRGGQLPTEAQWEFAARGPESLIYPWGNTFDESLANVVDSTGLMPVGSYPDGASWVGTHDMSGNAMEWVQDWFADDYYRLNVRDDPTGPETGIRKVERGGWWGGRPFYARSAYRHFEDPPFYQDHHIGFRVVSIEEVAE